MSEKLELAGKDFYAAIQAVMRFPAVGSFEGAGLIHLEVVETSLVVTRQGIALSVASVPIASGSLKLCAVDEKQISGFSSLCAEAARVVIESGEEIKFRCRGRETTAPKAKGIEYRMPTLAKKQRIKGSAELAERINYLAALALEDDTRPEVSCVMLRGDGRAAAVNQRMMAVFDLAKEVPRAALPIQLAKVFQADDSFEFNNELTLLHSGCAIHCMPSPAKALKDFPLDLVDAYAQLPRSLVAVCRGEDLARVVGECDMVLGQLAKTALVLTVTVKGGKLQISSENGAARFRAVIACPGKTLEGATIKLPAEEMTRLSEFIAKELQVKLYLDKKNGASFLTLDIGSVAFPSYR